MNNLRRLASRSRNFIRYYSNDIYEPDYLEGLKPKVPLYDAVNIEIRGYDFSLLESYQKLIHNIAKNMEIQVEDCWALPAQHMQVTTYKPDSEIVNSQYNLKVYERTVQVTDVSSLQLPILIRAVEACAPVGVTVDVVQHEDCHEEMRYIPDQELITLKSELDEMGGPRKLK